MLTIHSVPMSTGFDKASQKAHDAFFKGFWTFQIGHSAREAETYGYMHPFIVERLIWPGRFVVLNKRRRIVRLLPLIDGKAPRHLPEDLGVMISKDLDAMLDHAIKERALPRELLKRLRGEAYPVLGAPIAVTIDRAATPLFGLAQRSAFLVCYVRGAVGGPPRLWIPRRAWHRAEHPGKLDATVAGGMAVGETPLTCIAREAAEEVGLDEAGVLQQAQHAGVYTWYTFRRKGVFEGIKSTAANRRLAEKVGVVYPSVSYLFEMEVPEEWKPKIDPEEVDDIALMTVEEVKAAMARGEFKSTAAMVLMDFFVRHGILTPENEPDYEEVCQRLHRHLPLPYR